jgi:carboxypeptidase T
MKISRFSLVFTTFVIGLSALVFLAFGLMPSAAPASALSGKTADLEATPPPLDADYYIVRAYYDDYQMVHDLSTWTEPFEVYSDLGFVVLGVYKADLNLLQVLGFRVEIDEEATRALTEPRPTGPETGVGGYPTIPGFACYRTVEGTFMTAEDIVAAYPTLASWIDVGNSWEKTTVGGNPGYDMMVLVLTNQNIPGPKPKLFVSSSIHAREYTPAELMTRFAESLVTNYGTDPDATWILDYHEVHLMLHANPDGRKMAETGLLWRKNTNNTYCSNTNSRGADLNRNFYYQWGCCGGSSGDSCSDTYRGPSAASEPEVQSIQQHAQAIFPDQRGPGQNDPAPIDATGIYMDIHSYSQLVLWPWGFTFTPTANGTALQTLGRKFAFFNNYTPFQSPNLYITDGTTIDFGYGDLGVASYVFELGTNFFETCSYFESTILPGNMPALLYAAKTVRTPYLTAQGPDALNLSLSDASVPQGTPVTLNATLNDTRFNNSQGAEPVDNIAAAEYYIDVPSWITTTVPVAYPMSPVNVFNSSIEDATATIDTSNLSVGQHILFVRGQDNDANQYWGAPTAIFLTIEAQETLTKTASITTTLPGDIFTYTLNYQIELSGTHTYTFNLRDELPGGITVYTDTITLNGVPTPGLYNPVGPAIELTQSGGFTDIQALTVTLQASADPAPPGTQITNLFTTTLTVDGIPQAGQTSNPVVITVEQNGAPWLILDKTASTSEVAPGETFTYTLQAHLFMTYTHTYSLTLLDLLPAELTVLTDTILLDGVPAPDLYDSATHAISGTLTGVFTDTASVVISFQVMVTDTIPSAILLTNTLSGSALIDGQPALYAGDASVTVTITSPNKIYLPVILRE